MKTKFIETTQGVEGGFNHGKFMVARFDAEERARPTRLDPEGISPPLVTRCGWAPAHALVLDLQTGEGAMFFPGGGSPKYDLDKHRVWVCPMFEPFLEWLYDLARLTAEEGADWFEELPDLVELPDAPASMVGHRREGVG